MQDNVLTIEDVAKRLRVSQATVRKLIDEGKIDAFRVGNQWRITEEALERFMQQRNT